ncbi:hypothetical protein HK098_001516 [Nowakowskiella sp. JEL0407]|nr:hypothetical protein HK098_001516 [Nowakowskiella sp. JEL0407]
MNALPTHVDKLLPPLMLTHRYNESKPEKLETLIEFSREKLKIEPIITEEDEFDDETPFTPSQRTFETFQDAVSEIKRLEKELYDSSVRYERRISRLRARSAKNRAESAVKMFELQEEMRAALKEHQLAKRETAPTTTLPPTIKEIFSKQNELLAEIESLKNMLNSKNHLICELSMRIYDQDNAKSTEPLQKKDPEGPAKSTLRWSSAAYEEIEEKPINWTSIQNSLKESDDFINKFSASSLSGTIRPKISHLQFSNELNVQNLTPYPPPTTISPTSHKFRNNSHVARNMSAVNLKPIPRPEIVSASIADAANV